MLYSERDVGREKALAAKERPEALNSEIQVGGLVSVVSEKNASGLVACMPGAFADTRQAAPAGEG